MKELNFKTIGEFHAYYNLPEPENPLFSILCTEHDPHEMVQCETTSEAVSATNGFYSINLKNIVSGELLYGRTQYDSSKGTLLFVAPRQTLIAKDIAVSSEAWHLCFDEEYVRGFDLARRLKRYGFFNYNVNEALHLTAKEEETIKSILRNMEAEYHNNQDEFSKEIILSHLDALLKYADRFYKRQFLNRKAINTSLVTRFNAILDSYFATHDLEVDGVPTVDWMAAQLGVSHRYMSDSIKVETGKTAIDHINLYIIEEAKNRLLEPNASVSETAYKLGFEYPQYFSRLFKKKVGKSPSEYIRMYAIN